ncbi:hypothetical protein GQ43DRAFT_367852, partial [Delitschia confertaspora ATCC 74209]
FAPPDIPHSRTVQGLSDLFRHYEIPKDFVEEGLKNVSLSFGTHTDAAEVTTIWFHFVCKDIDLREAQDGWEIFHSGYNEERGSAAFRERSQANFNWIRPGFVLKISPSAGAVSKRISLFCFGAPSTISDHFKQRLNLGYDEVLDDPYMLLEVVMEKLSWFVDERAWMVAEVFGQIEETTIEEAKCPGKAGKDINFPGLHSIAKHIIFLQEASQIMLVLVEKLHALHKETIDQSPTNQQKATERALEYRKSLIQSTQHRLSSVDKRMANILALSFNLVTQTDSKTMQKESKSMKTIAVVTLVFLPLTTVAAILGSQMFTLSPDKPFHLRVSGDFWLLWVISVPLTLFVLVLWQLWYRPARDKIMHGQHPWWRRWLTNVQNTLKKSSGQRASLPR